MYCLDTNIVVDVLRGDTILGEKIKRLQEEDTGIAITTITAFELFKGAFLSKTQEKELMCLRAFLAAAQTVEANLLSYEEFGKEFTRLQKVGKMPNEIDLMIACIAKTNGFTLVTRNKKDFEWMNINFEVW